MTELHSRLHLWVHAARPKTLWAAFAPVLIGSAMAAADGVFHAPSALAALLGAFLIQIGTNFANDYGDYIKGADAHDRQGPLRVTQAGLVTPQAMRLATVLTFLAALACFFALVARGGWPLVAIGVASVVSGALYTLGPRPLGYLGLGDCFVLVFFGPVAVGGTYYVQARAWSGASLLAGVGPGLLAVAILVVNNLRDIEGDAKAGKRTLAVRLGRRFARLEYAACVFAATVAVPLALWLAGGCAHPGALLPILALPAFRGSLRAVFAATVPAQLNPQLGATARGLLIFSVLFAVGWLWR